MIRIKLPKIVGTKTESPLDVFYGIIKKRCGVKRNRLLNQSAVYVSEETSETLRTAESKWLNTRNKRHARSQWAWSFGMYWFNYSPATKEMQNGYAEVDEKKLWVRERISK